MHVHIMMINQQTNLNIEVVKKNSSPENHLVFVYKKIYITRTSTCPPLLSLHFKQMAPPNRATNEFSDPAPTGERGRDSSCTLTCIISINEFSDPAPTGERGRDSSCTLTCIISINEFSDPAPTGERGRDSSGTLTCIISKLKHANLSADFNTQKAIQAILHDQMINISGHCSKNPNNTFFSRETTQHCHICMF